MWNILVLSLVASLAGVYSTISHESLVSVSSAGTSGLAESMAIYRQAVVSYFSLHPGEYKTVDIRTMKAESLLPSWSALYADPDSSPWDNFRDADGVIYIFARRKIATDIIDALLKLSYRSALIGVYRHGTNSVESPVFGNTKIPLTAGVLPIPDHSLIWMATTR